MTPHARGGVCRSRSVSARLQPLAGVAQPLAVESHTVPRSARDLHGARLIVIEDRRRGHTERAGCVAKNGADRGNTGSSGGASDAERWYGPRRQMQQPALAARFDRMRVVGHRGQHTGQYAQNYIVQAGGKIGEVTIVDKGFQPMKDFTPLKTAVSSRPTTKSEADARREISMENAGVDANLPDTWVFKFGFDMVFDVGEPTPDAVKSEVPTGG